MIGLSRVHLLRATKAREVRRLFVPVFLFSIGAQAAEPVALIETVIGTPPGIQSMDYLSAGQVIELDAGSGVVVDYLRSCLREKITGGTVTIGTEQSAVSGGHVEREQVRCDGTLRPTLDQARASAGGVFRVPPTSNTVIERRLYSTIPIIDLYGTNRLVIERLDRVEAPLDLIVSEDRLVRERFYDMAADRRALSAGGVYRITVGHRSVVFQIDRTATDDNSPIAGRLLWF
jgi:hypothetical protein